MAVDGKMRSCDGDGEGDGDGDDADNIWSLDQCHNPAYLRFDISRGISRELGRGELGQEGSESSDLQVIYRHSG